MFTKEELHNALSESIMVLSRVSVDTFVFRKSFERDFELEEEEKRQILSYVRENICQEHSIYRTLKREIDRQEFLSTDYYQNLYPRRFLGAYAPVVYKTFAGVMAMSLLQQRSGFFKRSEEELA